MDQEKLLIELEEAFDRLSCGLNAIRLMVLGLESLQNHSADGFFAVCEYLDDAEGEVQRLLKLVSLPITTA